jgi:hypothetical protein
MREYGKLFCGFWTSDTIQALSDDGKLLAAYLLTNQHCTLIGCYRLTMGYMCDDLKWTPERVSEGFANLFANGFATRCEGSNYIIIHEYLKWNPLENPNQGKAAAKLFGKIPDSFSEKADLARRLGIGNFEPLPNPSVTVSQPVAVTVAVTVLKPPKINFDGRTFVGIDEAKLALWRSAYPALDLPAEMAKAAAWLMANPKNKKSNYERFLTNWFSRAQDRAARTHGGAPPPEMGKGAI